MFSILCRAIFLCFLICGCILSFFVTTHGQEVLESIRINNSGNVINVKYDLHATEAGLLFKITPYYLDNKGTQHLIKWVSGDVGEDIPAGINKSFTWEFRRELTEYDGEMQIQIGYQPLPPKVAFLLPKKKYRRWSKIALPKDKISGERYEIVELNRSSRAEGLIKRNGNIKIPRSLKAPHSYRVRVWDAHAVPAYSSVFEVKRKIPFATQIGIATLAVGAILYFVFKKPPDEILPEPYPIRNN